MVCVFCGHEPFGKAKTQVGVVLRVGPSGGDVFHRRRVPGGGGLLLDAVVSDNAVGVRGCAVRIKFSGVAQCDAVVARTAVRRGIERDGGAGIEGDGGVGEVNAAKAVVDGCIVPAEVGCVGVTTGLGGQGEVGGGEGGQFAGDDWRICGELFQ